MVLNTSFKAMLLAHHNTLRNLNLTQFVNKKCKRKTNKTQKRLPRDLIDNFIVCIAEQMVLQCRKRPPNIQLEVSFWDLVKWQ